jgi:hypothetical protein
MAKTGSSVSIYPGTGRRSIYSRRQAGYYPNSLAGGGKTVAAEKRADSNPKDERSVTQFLSENAS